MQKKRLVFRNKHRFTVYHAYFFTVFFQVSVWISLNTARFADVVKIEHFSMAIFPHNLNVEIDVFV